MDMTYMYIPALIPVIFILYWPIWRILNYSCMFSTFKDRTCYIIPQHDLYWRDHTCFHILKKIIHLWSFSCFSEWIWNRSGSSALYLRDGLLDLFDILLHDATYHAPFFRFLKMKSNSKFISIPIKTFLQGLNLDNCIPCLKSVRICYFMAILLRFFIIPSLIFMIQTNPPLLMILILWYWYNILVPVGNLYQCDTC